MTEIMIWETECGNCGGDLESAGYVLVERETQEIVIICSDCYDKAEDDYGITYISWS